MTVPAPGSTPAGGRSEDSTVVDKIKLALIDLDGTLLRLRSSEHSFFRFLVFKGKLGPLRIGHFFWTFFRDAVNHGLRQAIGMNAGYLKGESVQTVASWAAEYGRTFLREAVPVLLKSRIRDYREQGFRIVLLSGSLRILANELKEQLGAEMVIGGELEVVEGKLTGRRKGIYPHGRKKVEALFQKISSADIDWAESAALADRLSDLPVFELVGRPVAVHPEAGLRRHARRHGWEIIG